MSNVKSEAAPRPKPAKPPKGGKGSAVLIRVTSDTRLALEAEAERTGRSLSQTAEIWLDEARRGRAQLHELLGGHAAAAAIEKLVEIARAIHGQIGDHDAALIALRAAWLKAVPRLLSGEFKLVDDFSQEVEEIQKLWAACSSVLLSLDDLEKDDPVYIRAIQPLYTIGSALTSTLIVNRLADLLHPKNPAFTLMATTHSDYGDAYEHVLLALETLLHAGGSLRPQLEGAVTLAREFLDRDANAKARSLRWSGLGAQVADAMTGVTK